MLKKIAIIAFAIVLGGCGFHTVDTGHRGVKTHFGKVEGEPLTEGLYFVNPFTTSIHQLDVRLLKWDGDTEAYTRDVQEAKVAFTLNYQLKPEAAADTYRTIGPDWAGPLVVQRVQQHLKNVIGLWDAVDLIANRQKANDQTQAQILVAFEALPIIVTGFSITNIEYSDAFNKSVEAKVIAQQRAQEEVNRTVQVKQQAEQVVIRATSEAQSMKIRADALAQNPKLVSWEAVQKWDGKLPVNMYGSAALPFVDVSK
jgi:prohibitin 2